VVDSVTDGSLTTAALDTAVGRVLAVKEKLGLFDQPFINDTETSVSLFLFRKAACVQSTQRNRLVSPQAQSKSLLWD
jgi:beta-glucosidase-like glycosyl hydrolase